MGGLAPAEPFTAGVNLADDAQSGVPDGPLVPAAPSGSQIALPEGGGTKMSTNRVSTAVALLAALGLSVTPALAQEARRRGGQGQGQGADGQGAQPRSGGERRRPPRDGSAGRPNAGRPNDSRPNDGRPNDSRPNDGGQRVQPDRGSRDTDRADRGDREVMPRREAVPRPDGSFRRDRDDRRNDGFRNDRDRDGWRDYGYRDRGRYVPPPRPYRYSYPPRTYVVPYGYRPPGYRPGWSVNLYFGRPYGAWRNYPGYYGGGAYGYFDIAPGFAYGSLRIVDAPRDAQVFVDGYYAGVVDDYDGVFQRLNLEPGGHQIEIDVYPGVPPLYFDVFVEPGRTVTIHARP